MRLKGRLLAISAMVDKGDTVYDIGCDHGLLDIFLTMYNNNTCIASDLRKSALDSAIKNIEKYHLTDKIETKVSDGFKNLNIKKDSTVIISGMGASTIIEILNNKQLDKIKNLIVQSNNELYIIRKEISKLGFYIDSEIVVYDSNKYYTIIKFKKGSKKYTTKELKYGPLISKTPSIDRNMYFSYLIDKNNAVLASLPNKYIIKKLKIFKESIWLKRRIKN